jgi:hypothetical protein
MTSSFRVKKGLTKSDKMINMSKQLTLISAIILALILSVPVIAAAGHKPKHVTPYGDFCNRVSSYGMHKHILDNDEVNKSLNHYFSKKGLDFEIVEDKGRFIKAVIKNNSKIIDTIIFDRHTGRIRSVY